ncbi:MAG: hypothetical protein HY704_03285 [Gemmatimonadetes bacterium]|nr:hypothetical protein [Gemmatimonadota bacterium]
MRDRARGAGAVRVSRAVAAVALLAAVAMPGSAGAQVEALVAQRELEYRAARTAYEAAMAAGEAAQARAERATVEIDEARASGDDGRLQRAYAVAQQRWTEVSTLDRRVADTGEQLRRARRGLKDALEQSLDRLAGQVRAAPDAEERGALLALIRDRSNRLREIEAELSQSQGDAARFAAVPEITFDPRDGPAELRAKAELLLRRAAQADSAIAAVDREIGELEKRQQRERALRNFMSSIDRFDEGAVPIGRAGRDAGERDREAAARSEGGAQADSTAARSELSLGERIEQLRTLRGRVEQYREGVRVKAEIFRRRAAGLRGE